MSDATTEDPNTAQIEFWNGRGGEQWAKNQVAMDATLRPFADAALKLAAVVKGEHIFDIGCGTGVTTLALAEMSGPRGDVIGVDVSTPMIDLARRRAILAKDQGKASPRFEIADATTFNFKPESADLQFSRFGVMFFADPVAAFANIYRGLRAGGRSVFICWQSMADNDWFLVPMRAALTVLPTPDPPPPNAPGPFAFADKDHLAMMLAKAGFSDIGIENLALDVQVGGGKGIEAACYELVHTGPLSRLTSNITTAESAAVEDAVINALRDYCTNDTVKLGTRTWLVSALKS